MKKSLQIRKKLIDELTAALILLDFKEEYYIDIDSNYIYIYYNETQILY